MSLEVGLEPVRGDEHALGERVPRDDFRLRALARQVADVGAELRDGDVAHDRRDDGVELEAMEDVLHTLDSLGRHGDEWDWSGREGRGLPESGQVEVEGERDVGVYGDEGRSGGPEKDLRRVLVAEDRLLVIHEGRSRH